MNDNAIPLYDDEYCLLRIREGEERFFTLIFEKYRNQLFAYLYRVTKSKEVAEEIVLDVFLKLWHGREAITEIKNFEAFLHKVAHNKAIDFFRAAKRSPDLQQALWESITEVQTSDKADNRILIKNMDALIKEAMNHLSPQRKKVFELRNYDELSYAEIADTLQLSSNTVRNHLAASLQFIRDYLQRNSAFLLILAWFF